MKNYSKILLLLAAVMLAGLAVFARMTISYRSHETDPLFINDIIQTVKENIDHICIPRYIRRRADTGMSCPLLRLILHQSL